MELKLLSLKEEKELSRHELLKYYNELREYVKDRKLTNTTPGATFLGPKLKKITNKVSIGLVGLLTEKGADYIVDGQENIPNETVLYAHTHQGLLDNFAWIPATPEHCIIFHSVKVRKELILAQLNTGLVLVDKDDKESRKNAKLDTLRLLLDGNSISFFPESAYLLSPNKLHLPMNYGFLDIARKAQVPVVPVVSEYSYNFEGKINKVHISFCKPMFVKEYDDLSIRLEEFQEIISTRRFELIEENGIFSRENLTNDEYINYLKANLEVLKMAKIDIDVERANLWDSANEFYLFHHINDIQFDDNNNLLETQEVRKLSRIRKEQEIKKKIDLINDLN